MPDKQTIATYDEYADVYDQEVIDFWERFPPEFLRRFAKDVPGKRILNVGSGSGRDALLLRDLGLDVVCLDASKNMVAITKRLGFESHRASFEDLPFRPHDFDGVWAYTSLIHVPKDEAREAIRQLRELLRPGGIFAIGVVEGDSAGMVERKTMPGAARYFKNYDRRELQEMIEPLGFRLTFEQDYQPHNSVYLNQLYELASPSK